MTAGIDLALALVEQDLGSEVALQTARMLVVYARRSGGQTQFSVRARPPARRAGTDPRAAGLDRRAPRRRPLGFAALAGRVHLSERQFARVFRREVGTTPAEYVEALRVERARSVLETDAASLEAIARRCGFAGAELMRRAFQRRLGTSPSEYRQRFRPPLIAA